MTTAGIGDVDGDDMPDLVVAVAGGGTVKMGYLRNIYDGPARIPADLNDDGRVDGQDLGELFVQWTG